MKYTSLAITAFLLFSLVGIADVPVKEISRNQILSASPEWQSNYDGYQPKPELIEALKPKIESGIRIDIYLGLWCPDSRNNVPPFLKILDQIGTTVSVRFFGVQRKASPKIQYYVDKVQVERVPTFIFYRGDREIGRIIENPKAGLAEDTLEILSK